MPFGLFYTRMPESTDIVKILYKDWNREVLTQYAEMTAFQIGKLLLISVVYSPQTLHEQEFSVTNINSKLHQVVLLGQELNRSRTEDLA